MPKPAPTSPPRLFTIPPQQDFLTCLAHPLLARGALARQSFTRMWPEVKTAALADWTIFVPTQRARGELEQVFLAHRDMTPTLLPKVQALGDSEEALLGAAALEEEVLALKPAVSPEARHWHMLEQVWTLGRARQLVETREQAAGLAQDLLQLMDDASWQGVPLTSERLKGLVHGEGSQHWENLMEMLHLVCAAWPRWLAQHQRMDPIQRRQRLLHLHARHWRTAPGPVLLAGSTASLRATSELAAAIAARQDGAVVLPGLDQDLSAADWVFVRDHPTHPQHIMGALLAHLKCAPDRVRLWPGARPADARIAFVRTLAAPPTSSAPLPDPAARRRLKQGARGIAILEAATPWEEAGAIAWLMRETLETPHKTAALVTPNRALVRAVAAALRRWHIELDDSALARLADQEAGRALLLLAEAAQEDFALVPLLALLQAPSVCLGAARAAHLAVCRRLELAVLRPQASRGLKDWEMALARTSVADKETLRDFAARITAALAPLRTAETHRAPLRVWLAGARTALCALLASDAEDGAARLSALSGGAAVERFLDAWESAAGDDVPITRRDWAELMRLWLAEVSAARRAHAPPQRLAVWGVLEARLLCADRIILGGLNEGSWPQVPDAGPWLSRAMRARLGLHAPERALGQDTHDFSNLLAAGREVICTRARRADGAPQPPARWLLSLRAAAAHAGLEIPPPPLLPLLRQLDAPARIAPAARPMPRPPLSLRPQRLSVTEIETLQLDPYAIYARHVLKLRPADELDAPPDMRHRGTFLHRIMQRFHEATGEELPREKEIAAFFMDLADKEQRAMPGGAAIFAYWRARLERVAAWLAEYEPQRRRGGLVRTATECQGAWRLPQGGFTLRARADRIDLFEDGGAEILDYKSIGVPTPREQSTGWKPQLLLEGLILEAGGFADLPAARVRALTYIRLAGDGRKPFVQELGEDVSDQLEQQKQRLDALLALYGDASQPYISQLRPQRMPWGGDYDQLARVREWRVQEERGA